jgi:hypothetical protein
MLNGMKIVNNYANLHPKINASFLALIEFFKNLHLGWVTLIGAPTSGTLGFGFSCFIVQKILLLIF